MHCLKVSTSNFEQFISSGLRRFLNEEKVFDAICSRHKILQKHRRNARKQAKQLVYCLSLAMDYSRAADVATLATKPVLQYYAALNFALVEVLLKQDGRSSLDQARARHAHHGLEISFASLIAGKADIESLLCGLRAKPHIASGDRRGTFELWHRTAREGMAVGREQNLQQSTMGLRPILHASNDRLPLMPKAGLDLQTALELVPSLSPSLSRAGYNSRYVRGTIRQITDTNGSTKIHFVAHPSQPDRLDEMAENITFSPRAIQDVEVQELRSGFVLSMLMDQAPAKGFFFPCCVSLAGEDLRVCSFNTPLNEFGAIYFASYILSNLCRYYAEIWMAELERTTEFSLLIEDFCHEFKNRVPVLVLAELENALYITD